MARPRLCRRRESSVSAAARSSLLKASCSVSVVDGQGRTGSTISNTSDTVVAKLAEPGSLSCQPCVRSR